MMPWWFAAYLVAFAAGVVATLVWAAVRAWTEVRDAEQRQPDPAMWIVDNADYWWVETYRGYVPVRPAYAPKRTTLGPADPPKPVSRAWIAREIGIAQVVDPRGLSTS